MKQLLRRLRYLLNRRRMDKELADEMAAHREMAAAHGSANFGNGLRLREQAGDEWGWLWLDRSAQDLRYAARMLRRSPGFTAVAILMLALGIGVNVAAFTFFDLMVLKPMPVRDPATLVRFHRRSPQSYAWSIPWPEADFFRTHTRTLSAMLAFHTAQLIAENEDKPVTAHFVTGNYFAELGAVPELGGVALQRDRIAVVLSHNFWVRHFAGNAQIVGRSFRLNGVIATVAGVVPKKFSGLALDKPDIWALLSQQPRFVKGSRLLTDFSAESPGVQLFGRLRPGVTPAAAEADLKQLADTLRRSYPSDIWKDESLVSQPAGYAKDLRAGGRRGTGPEDPDPFYAIAALLTTLTLLILAVTCGNLGSLLLARGVARQREISIRISVGAGCGRLLRQLLTESVLLAGLGSIAGIGFGYAALRILLRLTDAPPWMDAAPDWRVIAFVPCIALTAAVFFGLTPALHTARQRHRATAARKILLGAQVAASCILMIVSGLLVRALTSAVAIEPGFAFREIVSIDPSLGAHGYSPARARIYFDVLQSGIRALPGVQAVALSDMPPLGSRLAAARASVDGRVAEILLSRVDAGFFSAMKIPLLAGRALRRGDSNAMVCSQSMAERLWPGTNPLGRQFGTDGNNYQIVGIAGNARLARPEDPDLVQAYFLASDAELPGMTILARTNADPAALAAAAGALSHSADAAVFPRIRLLRTALQDKLRITEYTAASVSLLGLIANLLACFGIAGVFAYAVSQQTKEIGLRIALGAGRLRILAGIVKQFFSPVGIGLLAGAAGAAALSKILRGALYGVSGLDPVAYLAAIGLFLLTAALAGLLPARRALRIDPMRALRQD